MIATTKETTAYTPVLAGRLERDKVLSRLGLATALLLSALLNTWNLAQNGFDNTYYSVAVRSMMLNFHNFFFASYDAGGFISVDKPPVALWIQAISAKIFGFSSLSILLPEALAGVASVALVYYLVRRLFGGLAAFVAAMAMAVTPIAVAVERGNNTDTFLMFTLLLAAWALTLATEKGRLTMLVLSVALVGVAFNIKMLEAFIVLPAFYLLYMVAAPIKWYKRFLHLGLATVVLAVVSLSWPLAVDLTPASQRPWVGGSQANRVLDLALNYNGLGRVTGNEMAGGPGGPGGFGGGGRPQGSFGPGAFPQGGNGAFPQGQAPAGPPPGNFGGRGGRGGFGGPGGGPGGGGMFGAGNASPLRLFFGGELAEQWSWLFPLGLFGLVAAGLSIKRKWPLEPKAQALMLWGGWALMFGAVFSMAQGIFHPYYLIMMAPAVAALVGIGVASMWRAYRNGGWQAWLLPLSLVVTALWQMQVLSSYPQWAMWLAPLTLGGAIVAAVPLVGARLVETTTWRRLAPGMLGVGLVALLISPLAWSITPALAAPGNASLPQAGPASVGRVQGGGWTQMSDAAANPLVQYLLDNTQDYFYLVAVTNSQQASSLTLETGKPVLAAGGFMGSDPALTASKLAQMVADKQVRFVMGLGGGMGVRNSGTESVSSWLQANCKAVDTSQFDDGTGSTALPGASFGGPGGFGGRGFGGNTQLYDCAP